MIVFSGGYTISIKPDWRYPGVLHAHGTSGHQYAERMFQQFELLSSIGEDIFVFAERVRCVAESLSEEEPLQ